MNTKTIYILLFFIFASLMSQSQQYILFGAKEKYYLSKAEKSSPIDSTIISDYAPLNPDLVHQVPLNKYIESNKYQLFIGLAVFDSPKKIINFYKNNSNLKILKSGQQKIKKVYFYKLLCKLNEAYIYKIIFITRKSKYTAVLNYVSKDYNTLKSLYDNANFINEKLKKRRRKIIK